jgi:hypothetical protein
MVPTISFKQCTSSLFLSALLLTQVSVLASENNSSSTTITNDIKAIGTEIKTDVNKVVSAAFNINGKKIAVATAIIFTLALLYQHYSANPKEVLEYPEDGSILDILTYYFKVLAGSKEIPYHVDSITRIDDDNWKVNSCKKKPSGLVGYILHNGEKIWIPTLGAIALLAVTLDEMDKDASALTLITQIPSKLQSLGKKLFDAITIQALPVTNQQATN